MIRKSRNADIELLEQFYDSVVLWLDAHENYPRWIYKVYPSKSSVSAMTSAGSQYLCRDGETIVGAFAFSTQPHGSYQKGHWSLDLAEGSYAVIHALAIDPKKQRHGIGTEIIQFCMEKAKTEGYKAIRVDIVPTNTPARKLFEKNGFVYVGDVDLELNIANIPAFSLYELNLPY